MIFAMRNIFARLEAGTQSQQRHGHPSISGGTDPWLQAKRSADVQKRGSPGKAPQSSAGKDITTRERELREQLQEKEAENSRICAYYDGEASRKDHEIQNLLNDRTTMREGLETIKATLNKKTKETEDVQRRYNSLLQTLESQQKNSKILQRSADTEAERPRKILTKTAQELDRCKDDLFGLQPVCRMSDASIIGAFDSLFQQLINWIDNEISAFEKDSPHAHIGCLFSGSEDPGVTFFLQKYPSVGEYLCRHMVNRYLLEHMFGSSIHLLGMPQEYTHMRLAIEHGMASLKPPRGTRARFTDSLSVLLYLTISDSQTVNIWRAETLSALATSQECTDLKKEQTIRWTPRLFEDLSVFFPNLFGGKEAMQSFHDQVTVPATTLVSELQGLATAYRLEMASTNSLACRNDLEEVIVIDLETGKTLKPGSAVFSDSEGVIGEVVLYLEPSLYRVNEGAADTNLGQQTWLVKLDRGLGSQACKGD